MFRGLAAFPITPASPDGVVDTESLQRLLHRLVEGGVDAVGLLGSTGFYPFFAREQRRRAVAAAAEAIGGRATLLVGVGALRTDEAVALAADAKAAGADAGLLAPVSYLPLLPAEVPALFRDVASAGLPLCIYNNPVTTRVDVTPPMVGELSAIPGVVAVKTGAPAEGAAAAVADLRARVPAGFSVGFSVDMFAASALLAGGDAWYSVLGGIFPRRFTRLAHAALAGEADTVAREQAALEPLWQLCRDSTSIRIAHLAAEMAGFAGAVPQRPVLPLAGAERAAAIHVLEDLALD